MKKETPDAKNTIKFSDIDVMIMCDIFAKSVFLTFVNGMNMGMDGREVGELLTTQRAVFSLYIAKLSNVSAEDIQDAITNQISDLIGDPTSGSQQATALELIKEIK